MLSLVPPKIVSFAFSTSKQLSFWLRCLDHESCSHNVLHLKMSFAYYKRLAQAITCHRVTYISNSICQRNEFHPVKRWSKVTKNKSLSGVYSKWGEMTTWKWTGIEFLTVTETSKLWCWSTALLTHITVKQTLNQRCRQLSGERTWCKWLQKSF